MYCEKEIERTCSNMNMDWFNMSTNLLNEQAFLPYIFDRSFLQEDIGIEFSKMPCSGLSLQDVKTTVSVSVRVLHKGINHFIQT